MEPQGEYPRVEHLGEDLSLRLAANTVVQVAGTLVSALIGLGTFLALTRGLGPSSFGDFAAAAAYLSIPIVIADLGLTAGVLREISAAPERTEYAMRAFLPLSATVGAGNVVLLIVIGLLVPFSHQTKLAIAIGGLGAFLTMMTLALGPVLQARLQMHWVVGATIAGRLLTLGLMLGVFALGFGFKAAVLSTVIGIAVTFLIVLVVVARQISLRPVYDLAYWRRLGSGSLLLGFAIGLGQINFRLDTVLLALFRSSREVGYYGAAYKFAEFGHTLSGSVGISVGPALNRFVATNDPRARTLAQRAFDVMLAASAPGAILMVAFADDILRWTAGADFVAGAVVLQLLAAFLPFAFVNHVLWRLLIAFHEDRTLLGLAGSLITFTIVLDSILIPPYGMKAAALVTVGVEAFFVSTSAAVLWRRHRMTPSPRYAVAIIAASAPAAAVAAWLPGPAGLVAAATLAVYLVVIGILPGTVRVILSAAATRLRAASWSRG